jgi:hypothetical protein
MAGRSARHGRIGAHQSGHLGLLLQFADVVGRFDRLLQSHHNQRESRAVIVVKACLFSPQECGRTKDIQTSVDDLNWV